MAVSLSMQHLLGRSQEPTILLPKDNSGIPLDKLPNSFLQGNYVCVGEGDATGSMVRSGFCSFTI